jgi:outer membrane biosynthesis protein TonB
MDEKIVEQILNDLYSSFEDAETQSAAILLFLKDQGIATEEKLAPYFEQAGKASDVRWRAARVRMASLLASAMKAPEASAQKQPAQEAVEKQNSTDAAAKAPAEVADKDKNTGSTTKAEGSDAKQEPSEQKSQTVPAKKSEQASEQKSQQASEPGSRLANKATAEKDAA